MCLYLSLFINLFAFCNGPLAQLAVLWHPSYPSSLYLASTICNNKISKSSQQKSYLTLKIHVSSDVDIIVIIFFLVLSVCIYTRNINLNQITKSKFVWFEIKTSLEVTWQSFKSSINALLFRLARHLKNSTFQIIQLLSTCAVVESTVLIWF